MGYYRAGFDVIGVDINPMPRYPFSFIQADAIEFLDWLLAHPTNVLGVVSAIHASPPCQRYSDMSRCRPGLGTKYPDLIGPVRERLQAINLPYVIENVAGSPLIDPVMLCATQFSGHSTTWNGVTYELQRHRGFESNWHLPSFGKCHHKYRTFPVYGHGQPGNMPWFTGAPMSQKAREVMGTDWMTRDEFAEAIPPDFTEYVGGHLMQYLGAPKTQMTLAA